MVNIEADAHEIEKAIRKKHKGTGADHFGWTFDDVKSIAKMPLHLQY